MDLVVPDGAKSIREGAIAPWNSPAYAHELQELLALADDCGIPVDVPFQRLGEEHLRIIREGVPERSFGGLRGFFDLAGTPQIQGSCPRLSGPLAQLSDLPRVRRQAAARRGPGDARGRQEPGRILRLEDRRCPRFCRRSAADGRRAAGGAHDAGSSPGSAALPVRRGARLPAPGPHHPDAQRRRSPARGDDRHAGLEPGQHAVRVGRAVGRTASLRRRAADRRHPSPAGPRQYGRCDRARGHPHPQGGPGDRVRSGGGRVRRQSGLSRDAARVAAAQRQSDRRVPERPARRGQFGAAPPDQPRHDPADRRGATTSRT